MSMKLELRLCLRYKTTLYFDFFFTCLWSCRHCSIITKPYNNQTASNKTEKNGIFVGKLPVYLYTWKGKFRKSKGSVIL